MKQVLAMILMLSVAFSGCAKEDADASTDGTTSDAAALLEVPTWAIGDYWTYQTVNEQGETGLNTYIVTSEQGGDYIVETDEKRQAEYNAREEFSMMGPQRKSDLAGSQGGQRVKFFDWPLEQDKTWKATWDGVSLDMVSHDMGDGIFHIMAHTPDYMFAEYLFDAEAKWMSEITWFDENGTEEWAMTLTDSGSEFTGSIIRYSFGDTIDYTANGGPTVIHENPGIEADWNEIGITLVAACNGDDQGHIIIGVNSATDDPNRLPMVPEANDPEFGAEIDCSAGSVTVEMDVAENIGGDWEVGIIQGTQNGVAHVFLEERAFEALAFPFE